MELVIFPPAAAAVIVPVAIVVDAFVIVSTVVTVALPELAEVAETVVPTLFTGLR